MAAELATWDRPHYRPGGGDPLLFYVLYGAINPAVPLSRAAYRSEGTPAGMELLAYGPSHYPEVPGTFREGYLWEDLKSADPDFADTLAACDQCLILQGTPAEPATLNYLRDAVGLVAYLLDQGGCGVYDPLMLRFWKPAEWKSVLFEPAAPVPQQHTAIMVTREERPEHIWLHTRGMRKFGRPDLSVHEVAPEQEDAVIELIQRLIEHQALGHVVPEGQEIRMAGLPNGGVIRHAGDLDDPDFNNTHLEVTLRG